jgi:hypothetical protein
MNKVTFTTNSNNQTNSFDLLLSESEMSKLSKEPQKVVFDALLKEKINKEEKEVPESTHNTRYRYRSKVDDKWISESVTKEEIEELLRRGTLSPYDFVKVENDHDANNGDSDPVMIIRLKVFKSAEKLSNQLRKIRLEWQRLWGGQLDEIMALISSGLRVTAAGNTINNPEPNLKAHRKKFKPDKILNVVSQGWQDGGNLNNLYGLVDNEIERRKKENEPNTKKINTTIGGTKIQQIQDYLITKKLDSKKGVYVFKSHGNVIYVGKTVKQNFKVRMDQHEHDRKPFVDTFDKMEFYCLDKRQGSRKLRKRIGEFESLMIFKHNPKFNEQNPESETIKVALEILRTEIKELKNTG